MAENAYPHFKSGVTERDLYGERQASGMADDMSMGTRSGGGGGFPWFRGSSPFNPTGPTQTPQATDQLPPEDQGPPDQRKPGGMGGIFGGMDSKDILSLLAALSGTVGALKSNSGQTGVSSATTDPAMQEVLALMAGRLKKSEPMFDSVQAMTNGLLPTAYQNRGGG